MRIFNDIKHRIVETIEDIKENPRRAAVTAISFAFIFLSLWLISGPYVAIFTLFFFSAYSTAMDIGKKAQRIYNRLALSGTLTESRTMLLSVQSGMLIYWYWGIVSLIPITTYEAWFIIGFPITILSSIPLKELANRNKKRYLFWLIMIAIYLSLFGIGQLIVFLLP